MELSPKWLLAICANLICLIGLCEIGMINAQRTYLDLKYINEYRSLRGGLFKYIGRTDTDSAYLWNLRRQVG